MKFNGFGKRRKHHKRKRSYGNAGQKTKFRLAAKKCKGKSLSQFRACMRAELKK